MRDTEVRLTSIYVTPTGSPVPSYTPNSEDTPASSFDLHITGEEGDEIHGYNVTYKLLYWAVDLFTMNPAPPPITNLTLAPQTTGNIALWLPRTAAKEDYYTTQNFTIAIPGSLAGHILQYYAVLMANEGDIVSFVQSDPFVLV